MDSIAGRCAYREIRLTRLSFYTEIFLGRFHYHIINAQYGAYFAQFYAPLIFAFGNLTIILSVMQNFLSYRQLDPTRAEDFAVEDVPEFQYLEYHVGGWLGGLSDRDAGVQD